MDLFLCLCVLSLALSLSCALSLWLSVLALAPELQRGLPIAFNAILLLLCQRYRWPANSLVFLPPRGAILLGCLVIRWGSCTQCPFACAAPAVTYFFLALLGRLTTIVLPSEVEAGHGVIHASNLCNNHLIILSSWCSSRGRL